jgi:phosphodiesterase/alkaline phosphatase D-like protein
MTADDPGSLAYTFDYGAAAFFVMDTRTRRIKNQELLGEGQFQALADWLEQKRATPLKFLVTSSALLFSIPFDITKDRWSGYRRDRERLLRLLAEKHSGQVCLLAGDLHSGHAKSAQLRTSDGRLVPFWEFCASPFEQETNWLAALVDTPITSRFLTRQKTHFVKNSYNFGLVQVRFNDPQTPRVCFRLVYKNAQTGEWEDSSEAG